MNKECKYCKWYRVGNTWMSICLNKESQWSGCSCIEADPREHEKCEDNESDGE